MLRSLFLSFANRSRVLGSYRRFQFRKYSGSAKGRKKGIAIQPPLPEKPEGFQSRSWFTYGVPAGLVLIAGGLFIRHNDKKRAILKGQSTEPARYALKGPTFGDHVSLVDTEGRLITKKNLLGNWVLLYFGYTSSPSAGPEEIQKMARSVDIIESKQNVKVTPMFVTIDPQRDSPSQLRVYLNELDPKVVGLTGSTSTIRQMAREFRVYFKKVEEDGDDYLIETSHNIYLLDPKMDVVSCFGVDYSAEKLSDEVIKVISGTSR